MPPGPVASLAAASIIRSYLFVRAQFCFSNEIKSYVLNALRDC